MECREWKRLISTIPKGLNYEEAAEHIGQSYHRTREWMLRFGKKAPRKISGHTEAFKKIWSNVDWTLRDVEISRSTINPKTGKTFSRERVRQVRGLFGKLKVGRPGPRPKIFVDNGR